MCGPRSVPHELHTQICTILYFTLTGHTNTFIFNDYHIYVVSSHLLHTDAFTSDDQCKPYPTYHMGLTVQRLVFRELTLSDFTFHVEPKGLRKSRRKK